jgi:electron transfer flavoprotein alpha subunit
MTDVLIVAELLEGKSRKSSLSAVTFARTVAEKTSGAFDILVIGEGAKGGAEELAGFGARKLWVTEAPGGYFAEKYAATIAEAAKKSGCTVIAAPASAQAKDLMPRVAAKLDAGYAADVIGVETAGGLAYRRTMYAGNLFGTVKLETPLQVVTVRLSEFEAGSPSGGTTPSEELPLASDPVAGRVEFLGVELLKSERPDLTEADVVVSGGRALKSAENFEKVLEPLVDALGAAMGASRAACDAGYVASDLQVGQTGKVVAPKLYVAVGISGAIQHLAGMKGSKTIVAINNKADEPIAQVADYYLVQDLFEAVPAMTEAVRKLRAGG